MGATSGIVREGEGKEKADLEKRRQNQGCLLPIHHSQVQPRITHSHPRIGDLESVVAELAQLDTPFRRCRWRGDDPQAVDDVLTWLRRVANGLDAREGQRAREELLNDEETDEESEEGGEVGGEGSGGC